MKKSEAEQKKRPHRPLDHDRYDIRFSGSGGQGIITAAVILAEAVTDHGKHHVCQTQSYGPEARGGTSKADVVISQEAIDYPKAMALDLLLAMNQASCDAYFKDLKPQGILIVDSSLASQIPTQRAVTIPFSQIARQVAGKTLVANMAALGAVGVVADVFPLEELKRAIEKRVPPGTEKMNLDAFQAGIDAAREIDLANLPAASSFDDEEEL